MWILVVLNVMGTGITVTETTLDQCRQSLREALAGDISSVKSAYCRSTITGDELWIVKDGEFIGIGESRKQ